MLDKKADIAVHSLKDMETAEDDKLTIGAFIKRNDFRDVIISNYPSSMPGDLNGDEVVNILDIVQLANMILSGEYADNADLNSDGQVNILDIVQIVNIILAQ